MELYINSGSIFLQGNICLELWSSSCLEQGIFPSVCHITSHSLLPHTGSTWCNCSPWWAVKSLEFCLPELETLVQLRQHRTDDSIHLEITDFSYLSKSSEKAHHYLLKVLLFCLFVLSKVMNNFIFELLTVLFMMCWHFS